MKRRIRDQTLHLRVLALLGLAVSGCGPTVTELESELLPEPRPPAQRAGLAPAYVRSQINDPKLRALAQEFKTWVLLQRTTARPPEPPPRPRPEFPTGTTQQQPAGTRTNSAPLFSRVEVLPPTPTVLPYGVGAYQQEPRLPAILSTGPGWAIQQPEEKEAVAARAFRELAGRLEALQLDPPLRPTLTIQTPSGLELAWINDLVAGRKNIHGDEQ
jgi:hypothetical protein